VPFRDGLVVACECMHCWYWRADTCRDDNIAFVLRHAWGMKAVHGCKTKWDRKDAEAIARLLKGGNFPLAYAYPKERRGLRDLLRVPGGSSLPKLLDQHCRQTFGKVQLTVRQVMSWMKQHQKRTGQWPVISSGEVLDAPGENWRSIDMSLRFGNRGLPAGLSLRRLRVLMEEQDRM
jgi:hypothetical protein